MTENKRVNAYDNMVKHLHDSLENTSKTLAHGLEAAKEKTSEFGGLTQEELNKVADNVKRDLEGAARSLSGEGNDSLKEWFKFDIDLIENFALDAFMNCADKTRVGLAQLEQLAQESSIYETGEITSPGTFTCLSCGKEIVFTTTSEIPACPACGNNTFQRS